MLPVIRRQIAVLAICGLGWSVSGFAPSPLGSPAWGQQRGEEFALAWLRSAATAPRRVSYEGTKTVTIWAGSVQASQVRVYHEAPDRTRLEYLPAGNQPERIVVISGRTEVEFIPSKGQYVRRPARGVDEEGLARRILPQILDNYDVQFAGAETVAGRSGRIIDVRSKFPGRPRLRIWVDTQTRLILRFERYGPAGALREASAFLSIQMNPVLSADLFTLAPPPGAQVQTRQPGGRLTMEQVAKQVGFVPQLPAYLPPGYQRVGSRVSMIRGTPTATFAFSDGVSTLTLFESRGPQGPPSNGRRVRVGSSEGTTVPRGLATLLHWNSGGISFTLVGDLSQDELVRVGASVPPVGTSHAPSSARSEELVSTSSTPSVAAGQAWRGRRPASTMRIGTWLAPLVQVPAAEAASAGPRPPVLAILPDARLAILPDARPAILPDARPAWLPPVPVSPYITNDTHPIGPGIRAEEEQIWEALDARGLTPFAVKVTVASDGVSTLPDRRLARLAWIWFVYGMDWTGGRSAILREVQESVLALSVTALEADPRVDRVILSGYFHKSGRFDGRRTDATFTARLYRDRLLSRPPGLDPGAALAYAGDVWYSPELLAGTLVERAAMPHDPHLPPGVRAPGPGPAGDRSVESAERFQGTVLQRILETKDRLAGLLFGVESRGRMWRGNPRRREIALTFDDGPSPLATPLLLAILHRYRVHATFFVIGEHARAYPYLMAEMAARGHEVGDHTFHHPNMTTVDSTTVAGEIERTAAVIQETAGRPPQWFRPPGGDYTVKVADAARRAGMGLAMWTENSGDWALPPAKIVAERVLVRVQRGSIILLHSTTLNTVQALPRIIVELQRRGYALVTMSQLAQDAE